MTTLFISLIARDLEEFLAYKRGLGRYAEASPHMTPSSSAQSG